MLAWSVKELLVAELDGKSVGTVRIEYSEAVAI
jgi:hypothetical protein